MLFEREEFEKAEMRAAAAFLEALVEAVPDPIHQGPTVHFRGHAFDRLCSVHGIEHWLTRPNHPWTNGQVERMNRTIKDPAVKRDLHDSHNQRKWALNWLNVDG